MPKSNVMNSEIARSSIKDCVRMKLWAISGGRCELCNRLLYSDLCFGVDGNFGELAHIHAISSGGPRHKRSMAKEDRDNIENLMLLCEEHHHMIDNNPHDYGDRFLISEKKKHEERIRRVTNISDHQSCRIVSFFMSICGQDEFNSERLFKDAVLSAGLLPMQHPVINLHDHMNTEYNPTKDSFIAKEHDLEREFQKWFNDAIKSEESVAVFSIAPQPLLFKLGTLFSDRYNTQIFQCHRFGHKWAWKEDNCETVSFKIEQTHSGENCLAFVLDLSAEIKDDRVMSVLGEDTTIIHLTIDNPDRMFVSCKQIQDDFVIQYRNVMERIKNHRPKPSQIHLFMAMPNSLAIRAGMDYMPKSDLPVVLYEQVSDEIGFIETIKIGGMIKSNGG